MDAIAEQFTNFYYSTFDTNRSNLAALYRDHSMLSFEGSQFQGAAAITEKLVGLQFGEVKHEVATRDAQPTGDGMSIIVLVTGSLMIEGGNKLQFSQAFTLNPNEGSYYVYNDVFRLVYG